MRKALQEQNGERKKFIGIFSRFGKKVNYNGYSEPTVLITKVLDANTQEVVTDHIWFSLTKGFEEINLTPGARIEFEARVKEYSKGYVNHTLKAHHKTKDYRLSHPTKIKVVT